MKQIKIIVCLGILLFLSSNAHALNLSRVKTWAASEILTAADLNGEFNNIINHSLTNNDIDAAAGIVGSKLDLSSPGIIGATTPAAATYTTLIINSTSIFKDKMSFTQTDNNEYIDSLADGYLDFEATTGLRWRINTTEQINLTDGLLAPTTDDDVDLGSTTKEFKDLWIDGTANIDSLVADTADINGGTMDGVQIGGTTATGELIINDALDDADGLGSQGTSGQYLQSAGAGANPTWVTPLGVLLSTTTFTELISSGDITITSGKKYIIFIEINTTSTDLTVYFRFDDDATATRYSWVIDQLLMSTSPTSTLSGDDSDAQISLGGVNSLQGMHCTLSFNTNDDVNLRIRVHGQCSGNETTSGLDVSRTIAGTYVDNVTGISTFEIYTSTGNFTGTITTYELN